MCRIESVLHCGAASVLTITSVLLLSALAIAKDPPAQTLNWPESSTTILRFTFGKFKEIGSLAGTRSYVTRSAQ